MEQNEQKEMNMKQYGLVFFWYKVWNCLS